MRQVQIIEKEEEEEVKESKQLTQREKLEYIFGDFLRGFYLVGCLFLDILVVGFSVSFIPNFSFYEAAVSNVFGLNLLLLYSIIAIVFLECILIYYQAKGFKRFQGSIL